MSLTDIIIQNTKDIQQLKSEQMGEDNVIISALYFTETGSLSDDVTGKSRGIGSGFILDHPTNSRLSNLGSESGYPVLGSETMSAYTSGSFSVI